MINNNEVLKILNEMVGFKICGMAVDSDTLMFFVNTNTCVIDKKNVLAVTGHTIEIMDLAYSFIEANMYKLLECKIVELRKLNKELIKNKKIDLLLNLAENEAATEGEKVNSVALSENIVKRYFNNI